MVEREYIVKVDPVVRKRNLSRKGTRAGRPGMTEEMKNGIVSSYNDGMNTKDIAMKYGVSRRTVYRILEERR